MAHDVISALDLDKESLDGKLILINELPGCEAFFFPSCLMMKQIKDNGAICLVTIHNDFNHYHNVGLKLGYNLKKQMESGTLININYIKMISDLDFYPKDSLKLNDGENSLFNLINDAVKRLEGKSVCIIIDDLTHLLTLDFSVVEINRFVQNCRKLTLINNSLVLGIHLISPSDPSHMISQLISHSSDIVCEVSGLKTGRSVDVSGSFKITRPWSDCVSRDSNKLTKLDNYLFKLFDRGVKVFAPGLR